MPNWKGGASGAAGGAAMGSAFGPWGTAIGGIGGGLMGLFGGEPDRAVVPKDMQAMRQQQIALLMSMLQPGAFDAGGAGSNFFGMNSGGLNQFMAQPSPEMSTYNSMRPILEGMMTGTGPQFERDIGMANATGGRFGSGNAIMRGEALRNLFNTRQQTASTLGTLAGQAGSSQFDRMSQMQNQRMQLLAGLLGMSGQATLSAPVQSANNDQLNDILKLIASLGNNKIPQAKVGGISPTPPLMKPPTGVMQPPSGSWN